MVHGLVFVSWRDVETDLKMNVPLARIDEAPPALNHPFSFSLLRVVMTPLLRGYFRLGADDVERVPREGPAILAPNHVSLLDPIVLQAVVPRRIVYLVTSDFYDRPQLTGFLKWFGTIRVDVRKPNRDAMRQALACLDHGHLLGIFPEGRISRDGVLGTAQAGVSSLMLKAKVPVVPVGINGTFQAMPRDRSIPRPKKVRVRFGDPLHPDPETVDRRSQIRSSSQSLMQSIADMLI